MEIKQPHNEHELELAIVRRAGNSNARAVSLSFGVSVVRRGLRRLKRGRNGIRFMMKPNLIFPCFRQLMRQSLG